MRSEARFGLPMRTLALLLGFLFTAVTVFALTPSAQAQKPGTGGAIPVTGEASDLNTGETVGTFEGTISNLSASVDRSSGDLLVSGVLNGVVRDAGGNVIEEITNQPFTTNVQNIDQEECQILFLDLGPIFLDVLGLQIDLSQITLDITAVPGPGNLLGNLLCAIAGLLDNPSGNLNGIANLLNQLFSRL